MSDLTAAEQAHVRAALRFLRARCGTLATLAKALRTEARHISKVASGRHGVSASLAVRVARLASVGVDEVLTGRFPPAGTCPNCGAVCAENTQRRTISGA